MINGEKHQEDPDDTENAENMPDLKNIKKAAFDSGVNHLRLSTLILQVFDLQIKGRMWLV